MDDAHSRLKSARIQAGYSTAAEAARALGIGLSTYSAYENGQNQFHKVAEKFARRFNVNIEWLLFGRGQPKAPEIRKQEIPLMGIVAAGSSVLPVQDAAGEGLIDTITLPEPGHIAALLVKGDSMFPRFMDGEIILYDPSPRQPATMVGHYAVVQTLDGRVMIKKLRPGRRADHWALWSHNAPEEETQVLTTHKVLGVLT